MMKTALLLIAAVLGSLQEKAASHPPKAAPPLYVSQKFGLMLKVPSGLSICPLPKKWAGAEEGTVLFLQPPSGCLDSGANSSTTRLIVGFVPSITILHRGNAGRYDNFDGNIPPLRSSEELALQFCPKPSLAPDIKLLGEPAFACRTDLAGNRVRTMFMTLYGSAHNILVVNLLTTPERLAADQRTLVSIASTITACRPAADNKKAESPACPNGTAW